MMQSSVAAAARPANPTDREADANDRRLLAYCFQSSSTVPEPDIIMKLRDKGQNPVEASVVLRRFHEAQLIRERNDGSGMMLTEAGRKFIDGRGNGLRSGNGRR